VKISENSVITPLVLRQLPWIPPLVFFNCGHAEPTDAPGGPVPPLARAFNHFAASVGSRLVRDGVRAAVVAGWAVDGSAAAAFADKFYRQMLAGQTFGEAVRLARRHIYTSPSFEGVNTWGAYQCYGDPAFQLTE
jgi:hypothetical protein